MKKFTMCNSCKEEYNIPDNRRFHAEPNCCSLCGPSLILLDNKKQVICINSKKEYINNTPNNNDYNENKIHESYINVANLSYKNIPFILL